MGAEPALAYVGLGANLGEREAALRQALAALGQYPGIRVLRVSPLYGSAPVDAGGPDYLNAVAEVATTLTPEALLQALQAIEQSAGRERPYRNAPVAAPRAAGPAGDAEVSEEGAEFATEGSAPKKRRRRRRKPGGGAGGGEGAAPAAAGE